MINIRSVTWMLNSDYSEKEFEIIEKVNLKFYNSEFFVRTKRATLPCISEPLDLKNIDYLNSLCLTHDIRWFNIPIIPSNNKKIWQFAYNVLKNYEQSFVNVLAVQDGKINYQILDESLKKKLKFICDFAKVKPTIINENIRRIDKTNLTYIEPHRIIINNTTFLAFNYSNEIFIENLSNKIKLSELEDYLKSI